MENVVTAEVLGGEHRPNVALKHNNCLVSLSLLYCNNTYFIGIKTRSHRFIIKFLTLLCLRIVN